MISSNSQDFTGGQSRGAENLQACGPASPRSVIRGESSRVKIDWLNLTFDLSSVCISEFVLQVESLISLQVVFVSGNGLHGFTDSLHLFAVDAEYRKSPIGVIAYGGQHQRGRALLQLTGSGCALVKCWMSLLELVESLGNPKITRVDLAADFQRGEYTVDDAVNAYKTGKFTTGGNKPSSRLDGDWLDDIAGRSFYVGKRQNGKMLRVYEKGKQLGDKTSKWTRFEVQFGSRDREIPLNVLVMPAQFFAGAYGYLSELILTEPQKMPTEQKKELISISFLLLHLKKSYGRVIDYALSRGAEFDELIDVLRIKDLPRRIDMSRQVVPWSDVIDQFYAFQG